MCTDIEIDMTPELLDLLIPLLRDSIDPLVRDKCSSAIYAEANIETYDDLASAIGLTLLNSFIVDMLKEQIDRMAMEAAEEQMHSGVKYKLKEPGPAKAYGLYTWYDLTQEYLFELSVDNNEEAMDAIDQLLADGFLEVSGDGIQDT